MSNYTKLPFPVMKPAHLYTGEIGKENAAR
ncbi:hypothetical protein QFZ51_005250 [Chitinophaga sp. W3I9]